MSTGIKTKVLLVDDEDDILFVLEQGLAEYGYHIKTANSVEEALACFEQWQPDFVVSDYSMPERTGLDLFDCLRLRDPDFVREGRFAILTGNVSFVEHHSHVHEFPILEKPVTFERLITLFSSQSKTGVNSSVSRPRK